MFQESRGVVFVYKGAQILRLFKSEQFWARDLGRLLSKSEHWSSRVQRSCHGSGSGLAIFNSCNDVLLCHVKLHVTFEFYWIGWHILMFTLPTWPRNCMAHGIFNSCNNVLHCQVKFPWLHYQSFHEGATILQGWWRSGVTLCFLW